MTEKEEKYLQDKLMRIQAIITGSLMGAYMFPPTEESMGDRVHYQTKKAMEIIECDVRNVYKYGKRSKG